MSLLNPVIVECRCGWNQAYDTRDEAERRLAVHTETAHQRIDAITELLTDDPSHEREKRAIVSAIEVAARANGGRVSANDVRPLLPSWVQPQLIGAVFQSLRKSGRLTPTGDDERNTDTRGRNTNKEVPVYVMREVA